MKGRKTIFYKSFHTVLLFLAVLFVALFGACADKKTPSKPENSEEETVSYSVIFKEEGFADVVISVNEGEGVENLPAFQGNPKTGYVLVWDKTQLSVITQDTVVNAVEKAKNYTIAFDLSGGSLDVQSLVVTFDADYTLPTPSYTGFQFVAWYYDGEEVSQTGKWNIDGENITLKAEFESWDGPF